jgi:hypothetical protein
MPGELDEQSQAIGQLQTGVASLERALVEHSRRDEEYRRERDRKDDEFRKAALAAFAKLDTVVTTQKAHAEKIDSLDTSRSRLRGALVAIGTVGTVVSTAAGLLIQAWTGIGSQGQ